jgi:small conductance mechanosensitive channel
MDTSTIYQGLTVLIAEDITLVVGFVLLERIIAASFRRIGRLPALVRYQRIGTLIQRRLRALVVALGLLAVLAATAFNSYLIFVLQTDVLAYHQQLLTTLPPGFWAGLGLSVLEIILLVGVTRGLSGLLARALPRLHAYTRSFTHLSTNATSIDRFFVQLENLRLYGLRLLVLALAVSLLPLPAVIATTLFTILRIYLIVALSRLLVIAAIVALRSLDELSQTYRGGESFALVSAQLRSLIPLLTRSVEYIIYVSAATLVVSQVDVIAQLAVFGPRLIELIGLFFLSRVLIEIAYLLVDKLLLVRGELNDIQWQQRLTLTPLIKSTARYAIFFSAILIGLGVLGFNTTPILAGIGGVGLIVGLGAQPVINDLVSGLFVLFENLYLVGDVVQIGKATGIVEAIDIRTTRIRDDPGGQLHIIRNGQINDVINFSKGYVYAVIELRVDPAADLDRVYAILREEGLRQQSTDPNVLEPAEVMGLQEFDGAAPIVRVIIKSRPARHGMVGRAYRKLVKEAFAREGIATEPYQVIRLRSDERMQEVAA